MSDLDPDLDLDEQSDLEAQEESEAPLSEEPEEEDFEISEEEVDQESDFEITSEEEESAAEAETEPEEDPEPIPEPEPEGPLELKLIKTHQWENETIVLRSSIKPGEDGYFLIRVIVESLSLSEKLSRVELNYISPCWQDYPTQTSEEDFPFCQINDYVIESYHEELLHEFYDQLNGRSITQSKLLNLWMRAWSPDSSELFELIQKSHSLAVLASLVERGANPLAAIKLN